MADYIAHMYADIKKYFDLPENAVITEVGTETIYDGYCETCYYEYEAIVVKYTVDGIESKANFGDSSMSYFLKCISEQEE